MVSNHEDIHPFDTERYKKKFNRKVHEFVKVEEKNLETKARKNFLHECSKLKLLIDQLEPLQTKFLKTCENILQGSDDITKANLLLEASWEIHKAKKNVEEIKNQYQTVNKSAASFNDERREVLARLLKLIPPPPPEKETNYKMNYGYVAKPPTSTERKSDSDLGNPLVAVAVFC